MRPLDTFSIVGLFIPLEEAIRNILIPSIVGRPVTDTERRIMSLPVRYGGLGIADPVETATREYNASKKVTRNLTSLIVQQQQDISLLDQQGTTNTVKELRSEKESFLKDKYDQIMSSILTKILSRGVWN